MRNFSAEKAQRNRARRNKIDSGIIRAVQRSASSGITVTLLKLSAPMLQSSNRLHLLRELALEVEVFIPQTPGNNIELYLKDVSFTLTYLPEATMADKIFQVR